MRGQELMFRYHIGVFYKSEEFLKKMYEKALEEIPSEMIDKIYSNKFVKEIMLKDGSLIQFVKPIDNARGRRFDRVIIDKEINEEIVDTIIMPTLARPNFIY